MRVKKFRLVKGLLRSFIAQILLLRIGHKLMIILKANLLFIPNSLQNLIKIILYIRDYLREHINMRYGATQRVSLHCRQKCRLDILARFGNRINMYDCQDDKAYFSTSVEVQSDAGFLGWVAGFGGDVIITGPDNERAA